MWSTDIEHLIGNRKQFLGCFPLDRLPPLPTQFPKSMIINTDKATKTGDHWLGLVLTEKKCFYFDSFGLPLIDETIIKYLHSFYKIVTYSNVCIQDVTSNKCGEFCIVFVKHVKSKSTYKKFISNFNQVNLLNNDEIVLNMLS